MNFIVFTLNTDAVLHALATEALSKLTGLSKFTTGSILKSPKPLEVSYTPSVVTADFMLEQLRVLEHCGVKVVNQFKEFDDMFDKNAQRLRAQQLTQTLAAQGLQAPTLVMPTIAPKKVDGPKDKRGKELAVGQEVARATVYGRSAMLEICKVTRIENGKVYLANSKVALKFPERVLVI